MTPEEHRQLDAEVAEQVMGYLVHRDADGYFWMDPDQAVPRYSTDIAAAWTVWEKLAIRSNWEIAQVKEDQYELYWRDDVNDERVAFAETGPLAICRAALLAVKEPA